MLRVQSLYFVSLSQQNTDMVMNSLPQVTVMLPVYNTEAYLEKCLGSVFTQSYPNLQVVIVNDASPDASKALVNRLIGKYQAAERTIFVSHEQNQGLAAARMEALKYATGDYLLWLDSDDYWDNVDVVAEWVAVAQETGAKVVVSDYYGDYSKKIVRYSVPRIQTGRQMAHGILRGRTPGFLCNKLVEREHFLAHAGPWVPGQNVFEDVGVTVQLFHHTDQVAYYPHPSFHYVQYNEGSYIQSLNVNSVQSMLQVIDRVGYYLIEEEGDESYRDSVECAYLNVKILFFDKVQYRDYKKLRAVKRGSAAYLPFSAYGPYDKLCFICRSHALLAPLGWLMGRFKLAVKKLLRS